MTMTGNIISLLLVILSFQGVSGAQCLNDQWPPKPDRAIPIFVVNLDEHPMERWNQVATEYKSQIQDILAYIKVFIVEVSPNLKFLMDLVDEKLPAMTDTLPAPYGDEMKGISQATGVPLGEIVLYNIFYEVSALCTSMIAQDQNGNIFHGRNLDFGIRDMLANAESYDVATKYFAQTELLAPCYYIVGGPKAGQGMIITRSRTKVDDIKQLGKDNLWFVIETNYDNWKKQPFYDDRLTPCIKCMKTKGQNEVTFESLFNVLSSRPMLNKLTVYTSLMELSTGRLETYWQYCRDEDAPCIPW